MRRCPVCNRSYTDELILFCADDGTQLVSDTAPQQPGHTSPSSQPTIAFTPAPSAQSYQPTPKKRKWLALIALAFGLLAVPVLLYSLSRPLLWEFPFRNASLNLLLVSFWGVVTILGFVLAALSLIAGVVALGISFKKPAQYGGRLLAVAGPVLSVMLMVMVIGAFAFRRMQGPTFDEFVSNSNYNSNENSNYNWNRSSSDNSTSNSNSNSSSSASEPTSMSETDKYRLFYAAAKSGDTDLQQRAAKRIGIVDSSGMPTSDYQGFLKGTVNWAFTDSAWVQTVDTPAKARAYAEARMGSK